MYIYIYIYHVSNKGEPSRFHYAFCCLTVAQAIHNRGWFNSGGGLNCVSNFSASRLTSTFVWNVKTQTSEFCASVSNTPFLSPLCWERRELLYGSSENP